MDETASLPRRKSINKRRVNVLISEDEDDQNRTVTPLQKKARYTKSQSHLEENVSIDVDGNDDHSEGLSSLSRSVSPLPRQKSSFKKRGADSSSTRTHIFKKHLPLDDSGDDFEVDTVSEDLGTGFPDEYEEEGDADGSLKKGKSKPITKGKGAKGAKNTKNSRSKGNAESQEKEIIVRDERRGVASSSMKIRIKPPTNVNAVASNSLALDPSASDPDPGDGPPSQKKRKLPPIKKNKTAASGASTAAAKPSASMSAPSKPTTADSVLATSASSTTRASAGLQGGDFNLQDRNVYEMLFKSTGGSNARASNLRENEDRRKTLNSLREADKARRALEAKHTFDLQAQMDKISAFEDRLRRANSCVLYPNILGAKMREAFEEGRRRREPQEEGEMPWFVDR